MTDPPVACTLDQRQLEERREGLLARLAAQAVERRFVENGIRLSFASAEVDLPLLWRMLEAERQCCRFLSFRLEFERELGPISLEITGPPGTREFLETTLGL